VTEEDLADRELFAELVLNGIGGGSLEEAEENLSHAEVMFWRAYRQKYGSLNLGRRLEQSFGSWMAHYTGFKVKEGTKVDPYIFMPHE
ncbi:hypothetical protein WAJ21_21040, partial [Acinetobacter baumannii]